MKDKLNQFKTTIATLTTSFSDRVSNLTENSRIFELGLRKILLIILCISNVIMLFLSFSPEIFNLQSGTALRTFTQETAFTLMFVNVVIGFFIGLWRILVPMASSLLNCFIIGVSAGISLNIFGLIYTFIYFVKFAVLFFLLFLTPALVVLYYQYN